MKKKIFLTHINLFIYLYNRYMNTIQIVCLQASHVLRLESTHVQ